MTRHKPPSGPASPTPRGAAAPSARPKPASTKRPLVTPPPFRPREPWTIIGVDCATQEERIGLARGTLDVAGRLRVERVTLGTAGESAAANICHWIAGQARYIVALDAPLGWPIALGTALRTHRAGVELPVPADELFHRHTDRVVHRELGKWPLAVGADRIARTARAALGMLAEVRDILGKPMPLAWRQGRESGVIEVSPAATLAGRSLHGVGYKADTSAGRSARHDILQSLCGEMEIAVTHELMIEDADQLDALLCVLGGADFARGMCVEPDKLSVAKKEGFIWFRGAAQGALSFSKPRNS